MNEGLNKLGEARTASGKVVMQMFAPPNALCTDADALSQGLYLLSEILTRGYGGKSFGGLGGEFGYGYNYENDVFMMHRFCWCEDESCLWCSGSRCLTEREDIAHREGCYQLRLDALKRQYGEPLSDEFPDYWHVSYGSPNTKVYESAKRKLCEEFDQDYKRGNEVHCTCGAVAEQRAKYDACDCDWHAGRGIYRFGKAKDAPHFWHKPSGLQVRWYKWIGRDMEIEGVENLTVAKWAEIWQECVDSLPVGMCAAAEVDRKAQAEREADPEYQRQQQVAFEAMCADTDKSINAEREA